MRTAQFAAAMVAASALAAPTSQAQDRPLTRAEVKAELARAQASGELQRMQQDYSPATMQEGTRSAPRRDKAGAFGRPYGSPATAATKSADLVAVPKGDEGE